MASTHNITTSFSGSDAKGYMSAALLSGKTLDSGAIDVRDNIQYKEVIQVLWLRVPTWKVGQGL